MGRLWYSAMATVTTGSTRISSAESAAAMRVSSSAGISPCASIFSRSMGKRISPSELTRTVRVNSGAA
jgi:hypothetical protein